MMDNRYTINLYAYFRKLLLKINLINRINCKQDLERQITPEDCALMWKRGSITSICTTLKEIYLRHSFNSCKSGSYIEKEYWRNVGDKEILWILQM